MLWRGTGETGEAGVPGDSGDRCPGGTMPIVSNDGVTGAYWALCCRGESVAAAKGLRIAPRRA